MRKIVLILILVSIPAYFFAQSIPYASWSDTLLTLNNGLIKRTIELPAKKGNVLTQVYTPGTSDFNVFTVTEAEFYFELNGKPYTGKSEWKLKTIEPVTDSLMGNGAAISLTSVDKAVGLVIQYILYPGLPVVRKKLVIQNLSGKETMLESVDVEKLSTNRYLAPTYSWIYSDYGRRKSIGPYEGSRQDALVFVHNPDNGAGIAIGNEAAGVLKSTRVFWKSSDIASGLTHKDDRYPFRAWLKPGASFATPEVFTIVYVDSNGPGKIMNTVISDFVRKHMGIRLSILKDKPTFVYNTWHPFKREINETLIKELARSAAAAGMKEFVIDDGWETNFGDWEVDKKKFRYLPTGIEDDCLIKRRHINKVLSPATL
ncbi:MAG: hypothetical protein EOO94_03770 [Pedobacter sp.]|nr:MAG: hypothetical protein EOO94_03770 [Pedobacter sp.]